MGKVTQYSRKSSATCCYQCVQYFHVSRQWNRSQCLKMLTDVDACDCIRGLYEHRKRVCTETRLWEKLKNPCRSGESNPRQYYAWPIGTTLFHFPAPLLKLVSDTCPWSSVEPQCSPPSPYFLLDSNPLPQSHLKLSSCYSISTSSKYQ